jgi:hypothetical protein
MKITRATEKGVPAGREDTAIVLRNVKKLKKQELL